MCNILVEQTWSDLEKEIKILQKLGSGKKERGMEILQKLYSAGIQEGWKRNNEWYSNPEG